MSEQERVEFTVLGRVIGTGTACHTYDEDDFIEGLGDADVIYDFVPAEEYKILPPGDLVVLTQPGLFIVYSTETCEEIMRIDIVAVLAHPGKVNE